MRLLLAIRYLHWPMRSIEATVLARRDFDADNKHYAVAFLQSHFGGDIFFRENPPEAKTHQQDVTGYHFYNIWTSAPKWPILPGGREIFLNLRCYSRGRGRARLKVAKACWLGCCAVSFLCTAYALDRTLPKAFQEISGVEYRMGSIPLPPDYAETTEWTFARMMFPPGWNNGYEGRDNPVWQEGTSLWTQDFPRADRHFAEAVRRLTRVSTRSVEQTVNLDDKDEVYNWPWLYAVQVGEWGITDSQASKLRDYLLRGGFFMADDLHGTVEWQVFEESMKRVFPDRPIVEIPNSDAIFHTVYDLDERYQVPGQAHLQEGHKLDGYVPHWRGIYDDKGRVMVAISFNSDIGDAWEFADSAFYPERYSALAVRLGVNYIIYSMTH